MGRLKKKERDQSNYLAEKFAITFREVFERPGAVARNSSFKRVQRGQSIGPVALGTLCQVHGTSWADRCELQLTNAEAELKCNFSTPNANELVRYSSDKDLLRETALRLSDVTKNPGRWLNFLVSHQLKVSQRTILNLCDDTDIPKSSLYKFFDGSPMPEERFFLLLKAADLNKFLSEWAKLFWVLIFIKKVDVPDEADFWRFNPSHHSRLNALLILLKTNPELYNFLTSKKPEEDVGRFVLSAYRAAPANSR